MDKGGEASAMAHNNQIVNGRDGREMEEEIEGGDHKSNNEAMTLAAMASAEKATAPMAVVIVDCAALWRWSMVAAAMAVVIAGGGGRP
jgi:hypothetical protein